jgi:hypothetical protein
MLLKDDENSTQSLAHPDQGPFQVVQDAKEGLLLANATKVIAPLPFPSILSNPLHPWTFDYENCSKHVSGSSATTSPTTSTTPTEMEVDPKDHLAPDPEEMNIDQSESHSAAKSKHPNSKTKKKTSPSKSPSKSTATTPSPKSVKWQSTLNFGQPSPASSCQSSPEPRADGNPSPSTSESTQPASVLKSSSYATPAQNHIPSIEAVEPLVVSMRCTVPLNKEKKPLLVTLGVNPVPGEHPCVFTFNGVLLTLGLSSRFDHSLVLMPLYVKDGKLPNIPAAIPQAFPSSYESLMPYVDVPNVSQLKLAQGQYRSGKNKGKKREQPRVYATMLINSELCIRFLVDCMTPILDMKRLSLSVKQLQCIRTVTLWAIGALFADVCPVYLKEILVDLIEDEIASAPEGDALYPIDDVPNFAISVKSLRLPAAVNKSNSVTNLEHYSQSLKRCLMIECE